VIILTERGSVYRSSDKGITWNKRTEHFIRLAYLELEEDEVVGTV